MVEREQSMKRRYLRFVGKLWDTGEFEPGVGWETERIARRGPCTPGYRLELLDETGRVLVQSGVEIRTGACRSEGTPGMGSRRIAAYVPLHAAGATVVLMDGDIVVHRIVLAGASPRVAVTSVDVDGEGCVHVRWDAEHERRLWFNVIYVDAQRRTFCVARELDATQVKVSTAQLPGGPGCSVAILATDGLRSALARSEPFDIPQAPPLITILAPACDEQLAPDQPLSLLGRASDLAGAVLAPDHLAWSVDGQVVAQGSQLALAGPLHPGPHHVALSWACEGEPAASASVRVHVCERSTEQQAWLALSSCDRLEGHPV